MPRVRQLKSNLQSDSSVGIATSYSNSGGGEIFHTVKIGPGAHPASCTMGNGSFQEVEMSRFGFDHPPPFSAQVKRTLLEKQYMLRPVSRIPNDGFS